MESFDLAEMSDQELRAVLEGLADLRRREAHESCQLVVILEPRPQEPTKTQSKPKLRLVA